MIPLKNIRKLAKRSSLCFVLFLSSLCTLMALLYFYIFIQENTKTTINFLDPIISSSNDRQLWFQKILSKDHIYEHEQDDMFQKYLYLEENCQTRETKPKFTKLVLMVIDALRVDFVPTILDANSKPKMPYLENLFKTNGIGLQSIAAMPTVTVPSTKSLISGKLPTFIEYLENLNAYSMERDNIVSALKKQHRKIVFYGDHIWGRLFEGQSVFTRYNETFTVPDYVSADFNVSANMRRELKQTGDWDVMILHYSGVDQIGHMYEYGSELFGGKLHEMDQEFRTIFDTLKKENEQTLIVVTGDHGMNSVGNHGGNSHDETNTLMIFLTPDERFQITSRHPLFDLPLSDRTFLQIDFVPTLASLFNFPIPRANQGRVMSPVLERFQTSYTQHLCSLFENVFQLQNVTTNMRSRVSNYIHLNQLLFEALKSHVSFDHFQDDLRKYHKAKQFYHEFLVQIQDFYHQNETDNFDFIIYLFIIIANFMIIIWLTHIELQNPSSIALQGLQSYKFQKLLNWKVAAFELIRNFKTSYLILILFGVNFFTLISTDFMQLESFFWHYVAVVFMLIQMFLLLRNYLQSLSHSSQQMSIIQLLFGLVIFIFLMIHWRQVNTFEDAWGADTNANDIHSQLSKDRTFASFLLTISLVAISTLVISSAPENLSFIFASAFLSSYIYKTQALSLYSLIPFSDCTNICTQIIVANLALILIFVLFYKYQEIINQNLKFLKNFYLLFQESSKNNLEIFIQFWVTFSIFLLDPFMIPLFVLNVLLEKLIYASFGSIKSADGKLLHMFGIYYILAHSAFYQIGNSNSLSTLNLNASCFVGFNYLAQSYICPLLMFATVYSTYVFWILSLFVRIQKELEIQNHKSLTKKSSQGHVYRSAITFSQIWRHSVLSMMLILTLVMKNHPFIWPVIAPKLFYLLMFSLVDLFVSFILSILRLTNIKQIRNKIKIEDNQLPV